MTQQATLVRHDHAQNVQFVIGGFLARYPRKTRVGYELAIRQWRIWIEQHGIDMLDAQRGHIEAWARHLEEERGLQPASRAAYISAVCGMYRFAAADGYLTLDPGVHVRRPKIQFVSTSNGLTRPQVADLLRSAELAGPTTYAMVCLLALNGLRVGECLGADIEHLGHERGYRTLHLPHRKGGKVGTLALSVRTAWAIDIVTKGRTSGPLLVGRDGGRLQIGSARRRIRNLVKSIGVTKRITPHSLRHTFVTMALDAGVSERDLMDSTGHSDSKMIRFYDRNRGGIERNATHAVSAFIGAAG